MNTPSLFSAASRAMLVRRAIHSTPRTLSIATAPPLVLPARRPVGAFRGGLFGFLAGSTLAGAGVYSYLVREYKASNDLLTEDIYNLHAAVQRVTNYVQALEERMDALDRKNGKR